MMLAIWILSASFLGSFLILEDASIPLIIQPQAFAITGSIAFAQCLYYNAAWTKGAAVVIALGGIVGVGAGEVGLVWLGRGNEVVTTALGVCSAILIVGGLIPQCNFLHLASSHPLLSPIPTCSSSPSPHPSTY